MIKKKSDKNKTKKKIEDETYVPKAFRKEKMLDSDKNLTKEEDIPKLLKKDKQNGKHKKNLKLRKKIKLIILIALFTIILILGITLGILAHNWTTIAEEMLTNQPSIVLDKNGNEIAKLGEQRKTITVNISEIPQDLKNAYISIEDERFYKHSGIDIKRTGAAIVTYIFNGGNSSFGGSTITQQLVKNLTGDSSDSVIRKVKEWWKAWLLETSLSKDEILAGYLNIIYVGPNIYGVGGGAKYYFNKNVQDLTLEECAFLAGINNSPNSYNPFGENDNTEKINNRTKTVLSKMLELEYIDENRYNEAISNIDNGLKFVQGNIEADDGIYSYHTDALIPEIINDIAKSKNISETFATNYLYMAGLTINSTQDEEIQKQLENEFNKSKYSIASKQGNDPSQAAMVIIDNSTGEVVACCGGLGKKEVARGLNRATQSLRQTGSAIKPIAVLGPALEKKIITNASIYDDTQKTFENGYTPKNYDEYLGKITVRRAVESSQNIPFVEIMEKLTPKISISYLEKMGITTLTNKDKNLALALGGLEKGISPLEMASAYATIANNGIYTEPTFYTTILNQAGQTIVKCSPETHRVFSENVAYVLQEVLTQPVTGANGTARYCSISGIDVAAKTGTTDDDFDRWLCGFTPYYTATTWFGYDTNETIYYNNQNPAGLIWSNVMKNIHKNLDDAHFEKPSWVDEVTICAKTGKKANSGCPDIYTEYFVFGTTPGTCTEHRGGSKSNNSANNSSSTKNDNNNEEKTTNVNNASDLNNENTVINNNFNNNINYDNNYENTSNTNNSINNIGNGSNENNSNVTGNINNNANTNSNISSNNISNNLVDNNSSNINEGSNNTNTNYSSQ